MTRCICKRISFVVAGALLLAHFGLGWGAGPAGAQRSDNARQSAQLSVRINEMEARMRQLTGQIEELSHRLGQFQDALRRNQEDAEYRFRQLEAGTSSTRPQAAEDRAAAPRSKEGGGAPVAMQSDVATGGIDSDKSIDQGTSNAPVIGDGNEISAIATGQTSSPGKAASGQAAPDGPIDLGLLARGDTDLQLDAGAGGTEGTGGAGGANMIGDIALQSEADSPPAIILTNDPAIDYDTAYNALLNGDYAVAGRRFELFLERYPSHELASSAQFWVGEAHYSRGEFRIAADAFLKSYTNFPDGSKVTESLFKLGVSLRELGETDAACASFSKLIESHPEAPPAVRFSAESEQQIAECG